MNELQVFHYQDNQVRTIDRDGQPWFVLKDVCEVLGLGSPHKVAERLDEDEKGRSQIPTLGGAQEMSVISESGLYNVILRSDKPEAKPFRRWVTGEVIPSIRKHGVYATAETAEKLINDPDFLIQTFTALKEEREKRQALEEQAEADRPKVLFADAVTTARNSILVGELAKILRQNGVAIGQNRLFQWLRENGYLVRRKGADYNMPTQKAMELGLFEIKETAISHSNGTISVNKTVKVTGKGQQYFISKFLENP